MGDAGGMKVSAPDEVDYILVKPKENTYRDVKVARGGTGTIPLYQGYGSSPSVSSSPYKYLCSKITFADNGVIQVTYDERYYSDYFTVEGYHYY